MKNKTILAAIGLMVLSLSCSEVLLTSIPSSGAESSRALFSSPVELVKAETQIYNNYNGRVSGARIFTILVNNLAYHKTVAVHQEMADGSWSDIPASFVRSVENGYEIWQASYSIDSYVNLYGADFVVKYTVNGQTYWDNNLGQDYSFDYSSFVLGSGTNVALQSLDKKYYGPTGYTANIILRNIEYNKNLKIYYSKDNGQSFSLLTEGVYLSGPDAQGLEVWTADLPLAESLIKLEYAVGGQTYVDDNFGAYYEL